MPPDLIIFNGNLITLDDKRPRATAMAVHDGKILAVGYDPEVLLLASSTTNRFDLAGKTVVPGFCDSHIHLLSFGTQLLHHADLVGTTSIDDMLARLSNLANRTKGWIQGHG